MQIAGLAFVACPDRPISRAELDWKSYTDYRLLSEELGR